jgi:hypothetical protein
MIEPALPFGTLPENETIGAVHAMGELSCKMYCCA